MMSQTGCNASSEQNCAVQIIKLVLVCAKKYNGQTRVKVMNKETPYLKQPKIVPNESMKQSQLESQVRLKMPSSQGSQSQECQSQECQRIKKRQVDTTKTVSAEYATEIVSSECTSKIVSQGSATKIESTCEGHLLRCKRNDKVEQLGKAEIELKMINETHNDVIKMNSPSIKQKCPESSTIYQTDEVTQPTRFKTVKKVTKEAYLKRNEAYSQRTSRKRSKQIGFKAGRDVMNNELLRQFERDNAEKVSDNEYEMIAPGISEDLLMDTVRETLWIRNNESKASNEPCYMNTAEGITLRQDNLNNTENIKKTERPEMIPEESRETNNAIVRDVDDEAGECNNAVVRKCNDARENNGNENETKGDKNEDDMSEAIDCDGIGTTETNGSKEDKVRACGETISKNDSDNLPNEIWTDGLSAKRIRLAAHGAYKNIVFEPNAAYKNFIVLIAFVAAMMRKIESRTWWWFDGMMKF